MSIEGSGASRAGGEGIHNEDAFLVEEDLGLYVVCDGASGTEAGEVAARVARDAVAASVEQSRQELDVRLGRVARFVVEKAMRAALRAVAARQAEDPEVAGLATTITMLLAHRHLGVIGHRGDSRAYLIRRGHRHQLTVDDELTESVARGQAESADFDVFTVELEPRDTIVLCTDGAEFVVEGPTITRVADELAPSALASRIVSLASRTDPASDATAVVVRVRAEPMPGWLELSETPRRTAFGHTYVREVREDHRATSRREND